MRERCSSGTDIDFFLTKEWLADRINTQQPVGSFSGSSSLDVFRLGFSLCIIIREDVEWVPVSEKCTLVKAFTCV